MSQLYQIKIPVVGYKATDPTHRLITEQHTLKEGYLLFLRKRYMTSYAWNFRELFPHKKGEQVHIPSFSPLEEFMETLLGDQLFYVSIPAWERYVQLNALVPI